MSNLKTTAPIEDAKFLDSSAALASTPTDGDDVLFGGSADNVIAAGTGNDEVYGNAGFDVLYGGTGNDIVNGGQGGDFVYGGQGDDVVFGDRGYGALKGSDLSADRLSGDAGADRLIQGDGNDVMTGGGGDDQFLFRWQDPSVALAAGTGRAFTAITDFDAADDTLVFDAAGVGRDRSSDVNFIDGGAGDGKAGGEASSFFAGAAAGSNGEAVMVLTDTAFASGVDAVLAAQGEATGDLIVYFNSTVNVASLLYVDGADAAHSIARFTDINSLTELQSAGFGSGDFVFV